MLVTIERSLSSMLAALPDAFEHARCISALGFGASEVLAPYWRAFKPDTIASNELDAGGLSSAVPHRRRAYGEATSDGAGRSMAGVQLEGWPHEVSLAARIGGLAGAVDFSS
jgi:hypothetical protein